MAIGIDEHHQHQISTATRLQGMRGTGLHYAFRGQDNAPVADLLLPSV
jgi:hypothetical protein